MRFIGTFKGHNSWPYRNSIFAFLKEGNFKGAWRCLGMWAEWLFDGFSHDELWSLDITLAQFIYPRLRAFRQIEDYQTNDEHRKKFVQILKDAEEAMFLIANTDCKWRDSKKDQKIVKKGTKALGNIFTSLWN